MADFYTEQVRGEASANGDAASALVDVLAECRLDAPNDLARLVAAQHACPWCLEALRVHPGPMMVSADGRRVLALFRAPDAEAVRMAYRHADVPFDRVVALRRIPRGQASSTRLDECACGSPAPG